MESNDKSGKGKRYHSPSYKKENIKKQQEKGDLVLQLNQFQGGSDDEDEKDDDAIKTNDVKLKGKRASMPEQKIQKDIVGLKQSDSPHKTKKHNSITENEVGEVVSKAAAMTLNPKLIKNVDSLSQAGKGEDGFQKVNQDSFLRIENLFHMNNFNLFAVLDGHGVSGHLVSQFVTKYLTSHINKNKKLALLNNEEDVYKIIKKKGYDPIRHWFAHAEKDLKKNDIDASFSGTTCVLLFQLGPKLICANVGDSRCIMVTKKGIIPLSIDQKPNNPEESERIVSMGGEISQYEEDGVKSGPYRVWVKGQYFPGIAMSRSIGDLIATEIGVYSVPEVIEAEIDENTQFIVLASDGVWEFLDNNAVKDIVMPFYLKNDPKGACKALIAESTAWWKKMDEVIDDITAICIFF